MYIAAARAAGRHACLERLPDHWHRNLNINVMLNILIMLNISIYMLNMTIN